MTDVFLRGILSRMQSTHATPLSSLVPSEPDPRGWFHQERQQSLQQCLGAALPLLRQAGLLRALLGYWVRQQASLEFAWPAEEEQVVLDPLIAAWMASERSKDIVLSDQEVFAKVRVSPALQRWSRVQWQHRLETLFLQRKTSLDRASCRLLRVEDKHFALELYHRIKADEISFEQAARDHSIGPERLQEGEISLRPVEQLPFGLSALLNQLQLGRLMMPLRLGEAFAIVRLDTFNPAQLDAEVEQILLAEQLQLWTDATVDHILSALTSTNDPGKDKNS